MSLSTDALLFSIVLLLVAIQVTLPAPEGATTILLAGLGIAVVALLGSVVTSIRQTGSGATDGEHSAR